jgi:hypothetical protein
MGGKDISVGVDVVQYAQHFVARILGRVVQLPDVAERQLKI